MRYLVWKTYNNGAFRKKLALFDDQSDAHEFRQLVEVDRAVAGERIYLTVLLPGQVDLSGLDY